MKGIKFRAWDKDEKAMLDISHWTVNMLNENRMPVMQFTGLCDKNGKEIYEGDVVTHDNGVYSVIWLEGRSGFAWKIIRPSRYEPAPMMAVMQPGSKVIGNIYEHPELMEVPHERRTAKRTTENNR